MRKIVEKWSPSTFCLFTSLKALRTLTRLGVVPKEDAWRKWTRAFCSGEQCKFSLPAFALNPLSDTQRSERLSHFSSPKRLREHIANRLGSFFRTHRDLLRRRVDWRRSGVRTSARNTIHQVTPPTSSLGSSSGPQMGARCYQIDGAQWSGCHHGPRSSFARSGVSVMSHERVVPKWPKEMPIAALFRRLVSCGGVHDRRRKRQDGKCVR